MNLSELIGTYLLARAVVIAYSSDSFRQPSAMRSDGLRKVPTKDVAVTKTASYAGFMAGKPFQSKLIPYESLIRDLRAAGRAYREISKILKQDHGIDAHPDTINSFVIVRARGAKVYVLPDPQPSPPAPAKAPAVPRKATPKAETAAEPPQESSGFFDKPSSQPADRKKPKYNIEL